MYSRLFTLLALLLASGCQAPLTQLQTLSQAHGHRVEIQPTQPFPLALSVPLKAPGALRLRVYLEGDGRAWATSSQPSLDPSPRNLLLARLALEDPQPSLYLARPCQFVSAPGCRAAMWTDQRFGKAVLDSLDQALSGIKQRYGNQEFELIGYSGGGALALLLAARRSDVTQVQTLAGNLSPRYWAQTLQLTPLAGSLEPLDYRQRLRDLPQRHLLGLQDRSVPASLFEHYRVELGSTRCLQQVALPGVSHAEGWTQAWAQWRDQPLRCKP